MAIDYFLGVHGVYEIFRELVESTFGVSYVFMAASV